MNASFPLPTGLLPEIDLERFRALGRGKPAVLNMNDLRPALRQFAWAASVTPTIVLELDRARTTNLRHNVARTPNDLFDSDGSTLLRQPRADARFGRER